MMVWKGEPVRNPFRSRVKDALQVALLFTKVGLMAAWDWGRRAVGWVL